MTETTEPENEKNVYENVYTHELTLDYDPKKCVIVGATTGTLEDFRQWHEQNQKTGEEMKHDST